MTESDNAYFKHCVRLLDSLPDQPPSSNGTRVDPFALSAQELSVHMARLWHNNEQSNIPGKTKDDPAFTPMSLNNTIAEIVNIPQASTFRTSPNLSTDTGVSHESTEDVKPDLSRQLQGAEQSAHVIFH